MRLKNILFLIIFSFVLFSCSEEKENNLPVPAETQVSGEITKDTVWTLEKSPFIVIDDVIVEREVTLTIEPHVEILFKQNKGLTIKGILIADGSAKGTISDSSEFIKFTSNQLIPDLGDWRGIEFKNTNNDKSILKYAKIKYAQQGLYIFSSSPKIERCIIQNNNTGILAKDMFSSVTHCIISNNIYGMDLRPNVEPGIFNNIIQQNEIGIKSITGVVVKDNNFVNNFKYAIDYQRRISGHPIKMDARYNWWDSIDEEKIEAKINHFSDNSILCEVKYIPFATEPVENVGL